ncbi:hypothetical protein [Pseudoduganella sp. OTU4001]|uniref:hypothetical protein n=1 Tax=Pseudoduganella sp. OTU4001 TaxID=3043854 RepID=UPI00313EB020
MNAAKPRNFLLMLALLLGMMIAFTRPSLNGDSVEYTLATVAMARHASPDIRLDDIAVARRLAPEREEPYSFIDNDMRANKEKVYAAFVRGKNGDVFTVHFFGYSALSVLPYKALEAAGLPPFKCFQVVNLAFVFILGMALFRFFGNALQAWFGLALFMACGGILYWNWTSPECLSAAALLAGLLLFTTGAPVWGGLLAGIAAQQNPTILFFFGFAPLLKLCLDYRAADGMAGNLRRALAPRQLLGLGLGMALFAIPPLFNLWQYGVPNIIVKLFSDKGFVSLTRLSSFFFDLNQGMLLGVPAVAAALLLWAWRQGEARRGLALLAVALLFTLALAVPALAVLNWNSGAAGMMRYAFWCAMPLLFVFLWAVRTAPRWRLLAGGVLLLQAGAMANAHSYQYVEFSPLARFMLERFPAWYHPEPEIFVERAYHHDEYYYANQVYMYPTQGKPFKHLYNRANPQAEAKLCGPNMRLSAANRFTESYRNWRYVDGPLQCEQADPNELHLGAQQLRLAQAAQLESGWGNVEFGGGVWDGAWSVGRTSRLRVMLPATLKQGTLTINGHYFQGNARTRVVVGGKDLGWLPLEQLQALELPAEARKAGSVLVELEHEAPQRPGPQDQRELAFFLNELVLR